MRSLSSAALAALQAATGEERVFLIALEFSPSGFLRLSTGTRDIDFDGFTWQAVGGNLLIGGVEESADRKGVGVDFTLSGVDQTVVSLLLSEKWRGRTAQIWQLLLDPTTGVVVDSIELFNGIQLDNFEIKEVNERGKPLSVTIRTRATHRLGINEFRGIRSNVHSHQKHFAGDTFFQHTASLANQKVYWGQNAPAVISGGGGGGGSGGGGGGGDFQDEREDTNS